MTDVWLYHTDDGGEIEAVNGTVTMKNTPETAVYLCLFGGNAQDPGGADTTLQWWGNTIEADPLKRYRSKTQYLLRSLPAIPANLPRIRTAVEQDLDPLVVTEVLTDLEVAVSIPRLNTVRIAISSTMGEIVIVSPWEVTA